MFGNILNEKMRLNKFGQIVEKEWLQTGVVRTNIKLDVFIVMPNHIHDITM